ncbi:MAG: secondary thiamine-phosphate synthase enzyme YjbQ [Candidatus Methylomirabilales bacterium]
MKVAFETIVVKTKEQLQFVDITQMVRDCLGKQPIQNGVLLLNTLHTTAVLFINEFQAALIEDMKSVLTHLIEDNGDYRHNDPRFSDCTRGNAGSHLRSMLLARTLALPIRAGEVVLGRWQSIIFAELDGPQERSIQFQVLGE